MPKTKASDPQEQKALDDIETYGCHVLSVMEGDAADEPPFSYSIGIDATNGQPDVCIIGLKHEVAHAAINYYNDLVSSGKELRPNNFYGGFIGDFEMLLVDVDRAHHGDWFGWAAWYYEGRDFRMRQLVYPDTKGNWPWDRQASEWFRGWQKILGETGRQLR